MSKPTKYQYENVFSIIVKLKINGGNYMDFQTLLAIVIVGAVIFFVMKKRKDKKSGGTGGSGGGSGSVSKYKNQQRK